MAEKCMMLGMLAVLAQRDIRKGTIPMIILLLCGAAGMVRFWMLHPFSGWNLAGGIGIGLLLLLAAALTHGSVGSGDGYLFCVTGCMLGFRENLYLLMTALVFSACCALILLVKYRCGRKQQIPFVPFVLAAYVVMLVC